MLPAKGGDWGTDWIHLLNPKTLLNLHLVLLSIASLAAIAVVKQHQQHVAVEDSHELVEIFRGSEANAKFELKKLLTNRPKKESELPD